MEPHVSALLDRLNAISTSIARETYVLALIALGSIGKERDRLDAHSDLDFFVIVEPAFKAALIDDLFWLERAAPISYSFRNTVDGHKVLFQDGIYAEFAVFGPADLAGIPADGGLVVWHAEGVDPADLTMYAPAPREPRSVDWLLGEILTNLYVGLTRQARGERLSAERFIQGHAVNLLLELYGLIEPSAAIAVDPFDGARRFEQRFPATTAQLPEWVPGYDGNVAAALAILAAVERHFTVNQPLKDAILTQAQLETK